MVTHTHTHTHTQYIHTYRPGKIMRRGNTVGNRRQQTPRYIMNCTGGGSLGGGVKDRNTDVLEGKEWGLIDKEEA